MDLSLVLWELTEMQLVLVWELNQLEIYMVFCFADPKDETALYRDANLTQKLLSPKRIMDG